MTPQERDQLLQAAQEVVDALRSLKSSPATEPEKPQEADRKVIDDLEEVEERRKSFKQLSDAALKWANNSPETLSFLYDLDLMPEQLREGSKDWKRMLIIIERCMHWEKENAALRKEIEQYREALNRIASWSDGNKVTGSFDEPGSAQIARDALNKMGFKKEEEK